MKEIIYLDNAATTPVIKEISEVVSRFNNEFYFNPSASYIQGLEVTQQMAEATDSMLASLGTDKYKAIFTASATEANNLLLLGTLKRNTEVVISMGEHPSVYNVAKYLSEKGIKVHFVPLLADGRADLDALKEVLNDKTGIVSIMHVSNETGAINDIAKITQIAKEANPKVIVHSDGVQAVGKLKVDLFSLGVDAYTISGHKICAPKGIGALIIKSNIHIAPQVLGGGQQEGLRSGTENVSGTMALCKAVTIANNNLAQNVKHITELKKLFLAELSKSSTYKLNSDDLCVPHILSLSFDGLKGEVLLHMLEEEGILISTGSACSSKRTENRTLKAMGASNTQMHGSVRISFGVQNTKEQVVYAADKLSKAVQKLAHTIRGK